jgi:cobalt-zinc-cadmium efflux system membrane fusion protein
LKGDTPAAEATLAWISPTIDEESKRAVGIGQLTNKEQHFCPGSYVRVDIVVDEQEVPQAVLREAVQEIDGDSFLFVPHAQGFEKRAVELGKTDGKWVEIISGIRAGEPYAATQTFLLKADLGKAEAEL